MCVCVCVCLGALHGDAVDLAMQRLHKPPLENKVGRKEGREGESEGETESERGGAR